MPLIVGAVRKEKEKETRTSWSFTLTSNVYSPPSSHVCVSMRVGAAQCIFSYVDHMLGVRAMCFMLVLGFNVSKCV